jgi:hypothetical protein
MADHMQTEGRVSEHSGLPPLLVFILAPFLICAGILLTLVLLVGVVRLLAFIGLSGWVVLLVWGIGFVAAVPLSFLMAVRIGRFLLGRRVGERNV